MAGDLAWRALAHDPTIDQVFVEVGEVLAGEAGMAIRARLAMGHRSVQKCLCSWVCRLHRTSSVCWDVWCGNDVVSAWKSCWKAYGEKFDRALQIVQGGCEGKRWVVRGPGDGSVQEDEGLVDVNYYMRMYAYKKKRYELWDPLGVAADIGHLPLLCALLAVEGVSEDDKAEALNGAITVSKTM